MVNLCQVFNHVVNKEQCAKGRLSVARSHAVNKEKLMEHMTISIENMVENIVTITTMTPEETVADLAKENKISAGEVFSTML